MEKVRRFFAEAGALGVAGVIFAFVLWIIAAIEHFNDKNIPASWFMLGGCVAFCFGSFMAWSKADDRANERKPRLAFSADEGGFYLTHLQGAPAQFIEISPMVKPNNTNLRFDPLDFLGIGQKLALNFRLDIGGDRVSDLRKATIIMFEVGASGRNICYPITISFQWNGERVKDTIFLSWVQNEKRFETKPQ
jgi:hypothetical protein